MEGLGRFGQAVSGWGLGSFAGCTQEYLLWDFWDLGGLELTRTATKACLGLPGKTREEGDGKEWDRVGWI